MTQTGLAGVRGYRRLTLANTFTMAVADRLLVAVVAGAGIGAMAVMMGPMFVSLQDAIADLMASLPDAFMAIAAGADMATAPGWYTGEMYSIMAPLAVVFVAVWSAAQAFAGELEAGTMGLLMANPVARGRLAVDKLTAMVIHAVVAATLIGLGTWVGVTVADLDVATSAIVAITVHLALLGVLFGALAALVAVATGRKLVSVVAVILVALVAYLWSGFIPLIDAIAGLAPLSPWHHYIGGDPLTNGLDAGSVLLLALLAGAAGAASVAAFRRRDIAG